MTQSRNVDELNRLLLLALNETVYTRLKIKNPNESLLGIIILFFRKLMDTFKENYHLCPLCVVLFAILFCRLSIDFLKLFGVIDLRSKLRQLYEATEANDTQAVLSLLDRSLINAVLLKRDGYTPFLAACRNGNTVLVKAMLAMGANVHQKTAHHETGFYLAAFQCVCNITSRDASCIHALYYAGADINACNHKGYSPIQMAAMFGHDRLVQWLIEKGADVHRRPTPYEISVSCGFLYVAERLQHLTRRRQLRGH